MQNALAATGMTTRALDNLWQRERDLMNYVFAANESELDRVTNVAIAKLNNDERAALERSKQKAADNAAWGSLAADVFKSFF
jgi:hypothetical protein